MAKGAKVNCGYDRCTTGKHHYGTKVLATHRRLAAQRTLKNDWAMAVRILKDSDTIGMMTRKERARERLEHRLQENLDNTKRFKKSFESEFYGGQEVFVDFDGQSVVVRLTIREEYVYGGGHNSGTHAEGVELVFDYYDLADVNGDFDKVTPLTIRHFCY